MTWHPSLTGELLIDFPTMDLSSGAQLAILYSGDEAEKRGDARVVGPILEASIALARRLVTSAEDLYRGSVSRGGFKPGSKLAGAENLDALKVLLLKHMMMDLGTLLVQSGVSSGSLQNLLRGEVYGSEE